MFHIESCHCPALLPDIPVGKGPRHQAGAIVWQRTPMGIQVLLVERSSGKGWGIPKGGIESGERSQDAALREAWEEAGVEPKSLIQDGPRRDAVRQTKPGSSGSPPRGGSPSIVERMAGSLSATTSLVLSGGCHPGSSSLLGT